MASIAQTVPALEPRWIELDALGVPAGADIPPHGVYLVRVLRGLRVKATFDVVLHRTHRGWRRPAGGAYVPVEEEMQRCQRIGDLPVRVNR